jgi:hypothetical protein
MLCWTRTNTRSDDDSGDRLGVLKSLIIGRPGQAPGLPQRKQEINNGREYFSQSFQG